ncbi:hypothetical protein BK387_31475 [Escherichia coli]|nr:hypothetical protein BK387_31475 [Escherichia coli]
MQQHCKHGLTLFIMIIRWYICFKQKQKIIKLCVKNIQIIITRRTIVIIIMDTTMIMTTATEEKTRSSLLASV